MEYLISRDSKGKIRLVEISYYWDDDQHGFVISRTTGLYNGKMTKQPDVVILKGKASRTLKEQVELEYNSHKKKYLDKGYKLLTKDISDYSESDLDELLGEIRTSQSGVPKPQLAKQADSISNLKTFDKQYLGSRKIDGLRCLIYMGEDGELHTASRGAINYDGPMVEILTHPILKQIFKENPGLIMDGECYKLGYSLQKLNSIARTVKTAKDLGILQFYWYDIVDVNLTAEERIDKISQIAKKFDIIWAPDREFEYGELRVQHVPHVSISGWDNIIQLHNEYVQEGWEGLVIRLKSSVYGPSKRTNDWIKVKIYKDDCFKVVGIEGGLRGSEDMVFILETEDGKTFKAKPFGDRDLKQEYWDNFDKDYKGHIGECKFFYYSDDGVPLQPSFKAFRPDLEK